MGTTACSRDWVQLRTPSLEYSTRRPIRKCGSSPEAVRVQTVRGETLRRRATSSTPINSGSLGLGDGTEAAEEWERVAELGCIGMLTARD